MTKAKLARLINLAVQRADEDGLCSTEDAVAYNDLLMEFQAWEPDRLKEIGAWIVREWLEEKANATSPDLDQAISAMRDLLGAKQ